MRGFRVGVMFLPGASEGVDRSQRVFGLQGEHSVMMYSRDVQLVIEWIGLVGRQTGSLNGLFGIRTPGGVGYGLGVTATPAGVGLIGTFGKTFRRGDINLPLTIAVAPSRRSTSITLMTGMSIRRR